MKTLLGIVKCINLHIDGAIKFIAYIANVSILKSACSQY